MGKIIMGIGIPGSGKTTVLRPFAEKNAYIYISSDDIRAELTGDASDQSKNKDVWKKAYSMVGELLEQGKTIVFDATFSEYAERKRFIQFARTHGAEKVQGVYAAVSFEEAKKRNKARDRVVPQDVITKMHAMLQENPPIIEDGFDDIYDISEL